MVSENYTPKVFISYSWSSPQHESFVLYLANKLTSDGIHIILDKWDLKEGHDKYAFMEKIINPDVSKVLIISDKKYSDKADNRSGGVGAESQIISDEIYSKVAPEKFIPVVTEYENNAPCLPTFLKSRIYVDLSNTESFDDGYEKLLRNIYSRPKYERPILGKAPSYLFDDNSNEFITVANQSNLNDNIYYAINELKQNYPKSIYDAQVFLNNFSPIVQEQLINAIYLGREHIHSSILRNDIPINRTYVDHIKNDEYANIIYEKNLNTITYLNKLEQCAKKSNFNLNSI